MRGDYPVVSLDGQNLSVTRKELELDPEGSGVVFTKDGVPMKVFRRIFFAGISYALISRVLAKFFFFVRTLVFIYRG